jgi:cobalt-zinc-cadmium efflux system membrane fusion protein
VNQIDRYFRNLKMSTTIAAPVHDTPVAPQQPALWRAVLTGLPNLIVFTALGGLLYFGHHTGWKMPKFSALTGGTPAAEDDWCREHLVPESQCIECQPELFARGESFGFCRIHGVAECVIDHPELAQVKGDPHLPQYDTAQAIAVRDRNENNSRNMLHKKIVQFTSAESAAKSGIDVDVVQERPMTEFLTANGEMTFDPTRVAHLSPRVAGTVAHVFKTLGDDVSAGEILALIDAAGVGQAKSQLSHAVVQYQLRKTSAERLRVAAESGSVPNKTLLQAEAAFQEAQIAFVSARQSLANLGFDVPEEIETRNARQLADDLRFLGIPAEMVATLSRETQSANLIPVRAPLAGVVVSADVVAGEVVNTTNLLYTASDPRRLWLLLNVRPEDARYVTLGQSVLFRTDENANQAAGNVAWISPAVDEQTRTLRVRVVLDNEDRRLRDKTFGTARIILRDEPLAVVVPREAVQSTSDASFVFVRDRNYLKVGSPKVFHVRQVRIGARDEQYVELLAGVLPGEVVATKGSPVLLAQLLRSNLGAACGCHEH